MNTNKKPQDRSKLGRSWGLFFKTSLKLATNEKGERPTFFATQVFDLRLRLPKYLSVLSATIVGGRKILPEHIFDQYVENLKKSIQRISKTERVIVRDIKLGEVPEINIRAEIDDTVNTKALTSMILKWINDKIALFLDVFRDMVIKLIHDNEGQWCLYRIGKKKLPNNQIMDIICWCRYP